MDWAVVFAGVATGVQEVITDIVPLAIPVLITLAGLSIGIGIFRKFGVKR